jgi:hypothetical protein
MMTKKCFQNLDTNLIQCNQSPLQINQIGCRIKTTLNYDSPTIKHSLVNCNGLQYMYIYINDFNWGENTI